MLGVRLGRRFLDLSLALVESGLSPAQLVLAVVQLGGSLGQPGLALLELLQLNLVLPGCVRTFCLVAFLGFGQSVLSSAQITLALFEVLLLFGQRRSPPGSRTQPVLQPTLDLSQRGFNCLVRSFEIKVRTGVRWRSRRCSAVGVV
jgi:hypothetical protein